MKKSKLLILTACLLALSCVLVSCNMQQDSVDKDEEPDDTTTTDGDGNGDVTTTDGGSAVTTTQKSTPTFSRVTTSWDPEPEDMPSDEQLLLGGVNISSYRIVYDNSPLESKISNTGKTIGQDIGEYLQGSNTACDFDKQTAERLQKLIKDKFDIELEIVKNSEVTNDIRRYEILIGQTNRQSSMRMIPVGTDASSYICTFNTLVSNLAEHYVIGGGSYGATWHAIDALEKYFEEELAKDADGVVDIANAGDLSGTYEFKTVACIGDSITRGSQAFPQANGYGDETGLAYKWGDSATSVYFEQYFSYPSVVQRELWKDYLVVNYGHGARTLRNFANNEAYYYGNSEKLTALLEQSNREDFDFDLVLIMLGTNDVGRTKYNSTNDAWATGEYEDYYNEMKGLIDKIKAGSPEATFVIMNAPHRCDGHSPSVKDSLMRTNQLSVAQGLKAEGYNVLHYDMGEYTKIELSKNGEGCISASSTTELLAHQDYYNIKTDTGTADRTHPNYRGYGKIAEGMVDLVKYVLDEGTKPTYMIDL